MFSPSDKKCIIGLARDAIAQFAHNGTMLTPEVSSLPAALLDTRACFITLTKDFELRGCVGHLEAFQPLYLDIIDNAVAAAFHDDRFNPVSVSELDEIDFEISVLTEATPLRFTNKEELLEQIRVGVDGVTIKKENASATFLPQVWDEMLDKKEFLAALCVKARLAPGEWMLPGLEAWVYQVEIIA